MTGRTLIGHESAKNQQLEDHYFGAIPSRVEAFMLDLEIECHKLGIPAKTRHNEVAPNQFELAPVFEETNLANDHNLLLMSVMSKVASRHNFRVLLHEKPFAGINGSGKHNNWSLGTDTGVLLFAPGKNFRENLQFITFVVNVMAAVHRHNALLKASIISATNAHRLGANEAPPCNHFNIYRQSVGDHTRILGEIIKRAACQSFDERSHISGSGPNTGNTHRQYRPQPHITICVHRKQVRIPSSRLIGQLRIGNDCTKCRRRRPAQQFPPIHRRAHRSRGITRRRYHRRSSQTNHRVKNIHFDGNGYSDEWKAEAARRGLDCETSAPRMFDAYLSKQTEEMFARTGVFSRVELEARNEVKWEIYTKKVQIESRVLGDLAINHIIPVATRYQSIIVDNVTKLKALFGAEEEEIVEQDIDTIKRISRHMRVIKSETYRMIAARKAANAIENEREKAIAYHDTVLPCMETIRYHIDKLELMVDNEMWPLPKYRELLFIR